MSKLAISRAWKRKGCIGCGLIDPQVEALGVWVCPNRFCLATGAFYLRVEAGYHGEDGMLSDEQILRMIENCAIALQTEKRPRWQKALRRSLRSLEKLAKEQP